jgi:hypothetical protein
VTLLNPTNLHPRANCPQPTGCGDCLAPEPTSDPTARSIEAMAALGWSCEIRAAKWRRPEVHWRVDASRGLAEPTAEEAATLAPSIWIDGEIVESVYLSGSKHNIVCAVAYGPTPTAALASAAAMAIAYPAPREA